ncbi:hypothetical protein R3P38DRAFT_245866 [Favolaschia claudopus]|uniref:Uncharacterized protein n=1 Tax=Favolaschia claudopus TaxID=2862362 RepID=A0AAW0CWE6_9AGAR
MARKLCSCYLGAASSRLANCQSMRSLNPSCMPRWTFRSCIHFTWTWVLPRPVYLTESLLRIYVSLFSVDRGQGERLPDFLAPCSKLESLEIECSHMGRAALLDTLLVLPKTMLHIKLHEFAYGSGVPKTVDDEALALLTLTAAQRCCPSLESLTLVCSSKISDAALKRFVLSRISTGEGEFAGNPSSLKRLRSHMPRDKEVDLKVDLKQYIDAGLDLEIIYRPPINQDSSPWYGTTDAPNSWQPA